MTAKAESSKVEFIDNPLAPETFASGVSGFLITPGTIHITFESARVNHMLSPGPVNRVVVARLVMPVAGAQALAAGLYDFLKQHGLDPVPTPAKDKLQ
jgi:hypothetical protein